MVTWPFLKTDIVTWPFSKIVMGHGHVWDMGHFLNSTCDMGLSDMRKYIGECIRMHHLSLDIENFLGGAPKPPLCSQHAVLGAQVL